MKTVQKIALPLLFMCVSSSVFSAGACTYQEAIMALEKGNSVRGMALMRMAHRDGDERASQYLAMKDFPIEATSTASKQQEIPRISLNQTRP